MVGRHEDPVWRCYGEKIRPRGRKCDIKACKGCGFEVALCTIRAKNHAASCTQLRRLGLWSVGGDMKKHVTWTSSQETENTNTIVGRCPSTFSNWAFLAQVCFAFKLVFYNKCCPLKGRGYETQTQRQRPQNT